MRAVSARISRHRTIHRPAAYCLCRGDRPGHSRHPFCTLRRFLPKVFRKSTVLASPCGVPMCVCTCGVFAEPWNICLSVVSAVCHTGRCSGSFAVCIAVRLLFFDVFPSVRQQFACGGGFASEIPQTRRHICACTFRHQLCLWCYPPCENVTRVCPERCLFRCRFVAGKLSV